VVGDGGRVPVETGGKSFRMGTGTRASGWGPTANATTQAQMHDQKRGSQAKRKKKETNRKRNYSGWEDRA